MRWRRSFGPAPHRSRSWRWPGGWPPGRAPESFGQTFTNPVINDFEIAPAGSLEWDILDRLARPTGTIPGTCPAGADDGPGIDRHVQNMRADLPVTMMGRRIEGEMSLLWDAAELFYVSATPADAASLVRCAAVAVGRRGRLRSARRDAGRHARGLAASRIPPPGHRRLLPVMNDLIDAMEAEGPSACRPSRAPAVRNRYSSRNTQGQVAEIARRGAGAAGHENGPSRS